MAKPSDTKAKAMPDRIAATAQGQSKARDKGRRTLKRNRIAASAQAQSKAEVKT